MDTDTRAEMLARYIIDNKSTIRFAAKVFGVSKSTVHNDVSNRLVDINLSLYYQVHKILENNFEEKHVRGGAATKRKYEK